ncbi:MAG: ABC transporter permease [Planctomycetota bacterium]|jgi:molybdate/tungstate transport system permease protein
MMKRPPTFFQLGVMLCGALILLFVLSPLVGMVVGSSVTELCQTARDEEVRTSVLLTLVTSLAGSAFFALFAIPFAWFLARREFWGKGLVLGVIDLPIVIPHSTAGIALLSVLNRNSFLGGIAEDLGFSFIGNPIGIALAMAFVSLPFLIGAAREGFAAVSERLEKTALTLGASPARVFWTISLPLAWRAILTGFVMMFARGLSEFGAVIIVAYHPMITPVLIYERFTSFGLSHARGVAVLFLVVCLGVFLGLRLLSGRRHHA